MTSSKAAQSSSQAIVPPPPPRGKYFVLPELVEKKMVRRLGRGEIRQVIGLPNERVLVVAAGGALLFDWRGAQTLWEVDCPAMCGALSPDGKLLALGSKPDIYLWDVQTGKLLEQYYGHANGVHSITFSPDGKHFATFGDKTVTLWQFDVV